MMQTSQVSEASQPFVDIPCDSPSLQDQCPKDSPLPLDPEAKEKLFDEMRTENAARLRRMVYVFAGPNDREDLEQEILLGLWESLDSYRGDASPQTWFFRVASNRVGKFVRRSRRWEQERELAVPAAAEGKGVIGNLDLECVLEEFTKTLPALERKVLEMCLDDWSYERMASELGVSVSHARLKVSRLRSQLASFIGM